MAPHSFGSRFARVAFGSLWSRGSGFTFCAVLPICTRIALCTRGSGFTVGSPGTGGTGFSLESRFSGIAFLTLFAV